MFKEMWGLSFGKINKNLQIYKSEFGLFKKYILDFRTLFLFNFTFHLTILY